MEIVVNYFSSAPWQDVVIAIGQWIFAFALIPTIRSKEKPPLATSISTGVVLIVFSFTFGTLSLWNAAVSAGAVGIIWFTIALQKFLQIQNSKQSDTGGN